MFSDVVAHQYDFESIAKDANDLQFNYYTALYNTQNYIKDKKSAYNDVYEVDFDFDANTVNNLTLGTSSEMPIKQYSIEVGMDLPAAKIIPYYLFHTMNDNYGKVTKDNKMYGYYISTVEEGRNDVFSSEYLVWLYDTETPSRYNDEAKLEIEIVYRGRSIYTDNAVQANWRGIPVSTVSSYGLGNLGLRNFDMDVEVLPLATTYENGVVIDRDEHIHNIVAYNSGSNYSTNFSSIGFAASMLGFIPGSTGIISSVSSLLLSITDSVINNQYNIPIPSEMPNGLLHISFVENRENHLAQYGSYNREAQYKTMDNNLFYDTPHRASLKVALSNNGEGKTYRLKHYADVDVITCNTLVPSWSNTKKSDFNFYQYNYYNRD